MSSLEEIDSTVRSRQCVENVDSIPLSLYRRHFIVARFFFSPYQITFLSVRVRFIQIPSSRKKSMQGRGEEEKVMYHKASTYMKQYTRHVFQREVLWYF